MPPALRPGDWICPNCDNHNFASRDSCNKCHAPKKVIQARRVPATVQRVVAPNTNVNKRDGDWFCPSCGDLNFARNLECRKCSHPSPVAPLPFAPVGGGMAGPYGGFQGGGKGGGKEGDWECVACGNVNFARRDACNRCNAKKAFQQGGGKGGGGYGPAGMSQLEQSLVQLAQLAGMAGSAGRQMGGKGGKGGKGGPIMPMAIDPRMKEGDWMCPACNQLCFASRIECPKCKTQKPGTKPGDWVCQNKACRNHNWSKRTECNKCGEARQV